MGINENIYYVYKHINPKTKELIYIGMGKNDRAYRVLSHGKKIYSDRHPDHSKYLSELIQQGYLPHEWVVFEKTSLSRTDALKLERELIEKYGPIFNRKGGPEFKLSQTEIETTKTLYNYGYSYDEIAFMMDCSRSTIHRIIKETRGIYGRTKNI